ncbi:hypothetical protein HH214_19730 [Mucilaginibacter robiniae]|uniref:Coproporphyrinogen III oxidase n=1 Tax=Mucilaginibacter robiniae TaxID=2728022 RepID=A0A7L5E5Q0_9SPHI|nr:hypothetical protein [Mucilaginibacter robiniae]QJD97948.1 hypothetical protein HH214_19730 [Mucilaginibacter robiniae]
MKKVILITMLAGSAALLQACSGDHTPGGGVDSVRGTNTYDVSNRDTSKTTTNLGGATLLDYSSSGGTTMPKGTPSTKTTMETTAPAKPDTAKAPAAATDSTKK